jgi:hypothetical protein
LDKQSSFAGDAYAICNVVVRGTCSLSTVFQGNKCLADHLIFTVDDYAVQRETILCPLLAGVTLSVSYSFGSNTQQESRGLLQPLLLLLRPIISLTSIFGRILSSSVEYTGQWDEFKELQVAA